MVSVSGRGWSRSVGRAEELLARWAAARLGVPRESVGSVTFRHEDGWFDSDSGTDWPAVNQAVVWVAGEATSRAIEVDDLEGLPALLAEIMRYAEQIRG